MRQLGIRKKHLHQNKIPNSGIAEHNVLLLTFAVECLDIPVAGARAATPATLGISGAGIVNAVQVARRLTAPQRRGNSEAQHIACTELSGTS